MIGTPNGKDGTQLAMNPETPAVYEEDIGLSELIANLPGNNPVYVKPTRRAFRIRSPNL
jgi:hypothetical protein